MACAAELRAAGISVNSADPGYCATDLNRHTGTRTAAEGAAVITRLALLPDGATTAQFLGDDGTVPW